jgi:hypothetical protein
MQLAKRGARRAPRLQRIHVGRNPDCDWDFGFGVRVDIFDVDIDFEGITCWAGCGSDGAEGADGLACF